MSLENYGIGFGQIEDFKKFLIDQGIGEFDSLPEATRQEVTRDFIKPKTPTLGSQKPTPIKVSNKKPDNFFTVFIIFGKIPRRFFTQYSFFCNLVFPRVNEYH